MFPCSLPFCFVFSPPARLNVAIVHFVPEYISGVCTLGQLVKKKKKKRSALHSDRRTDCLFTKRSQEAIKQKIALENCSF